MFEQLQPFGLLAGRILLALIFLMAGTMKALSWSKTADYMASEGMTAIPFFLFMAILVEVGGGLLLLLGYKCRWGALLLAAFLIPVTIIFHHFWTYEGAAMENQMQHFLKNVTIEGGLFTLAAAGAGRFALDALPRRAGGVPQTAPMESSHALAR